MTPDKREFLIAQYSGANERRFQNFAFFWQALALGVAAQAFLFTIALDSSTTDYGRYIAASLSLVVSFASRVLMKSQKSYQRIEGRWMDYIEWEFHFPVQLLHDRRSRARETHLDTYINPNLLRHTVPRLFPFKEKAGRWDRFKNWICGVAVMKDASSWWAGLLYVFMVGAVVVILMTACDHKLLSGP